jgi:hypothetical protein
MTDSLFDTMSCYGRALGSHASARTDIGDVAELFDRRRKEMSL